MRTLIITMLGALSISVNAQKSDVGHLQAPTHSAPFSAVTQQGFHYWDKGYLIAFATDGTLAPPVFLFDKNGSTALRAQLNLPGAARIFVNDAAVNKQGTLMIAGTALSSDGADAQI